MWAHHPRSRLLAALILDCLGQLGILGLLLGLTAWTDAQIGSGSLDGQLAWLCLMVVMYPALGWLFGSYTVLRWRRLSSILLAQRLLITAIATLVVVAIFRWLLNPGDDVWLVYRTVQFIWISLLTVWAFVIRKALRRGLLLPGQPRLVLLAQQDEMGKILAAWQRVPQRQKLWPMDINGASARIDEMQKPVLFVSSETVRSSGAYRGLMRKLEDFDSDEIKSISLLRLFDEQQGRLPPSLLPESYLEYGDISWSADFSFQAQLKRLADLIVASVLLLLCSPFVLLASLLIKLEDGGPVFYSQERSGWLGRPFRVYKLRTMFVQSKNAPASWTQPADQRITKIGAWLRKVRLDELPQLWNVLKGEMSLIGPRPERPELEHELEQAIPHYRKRHWMQPGLSGWAQVCAPYASSIEDSDLKLSYDLYYLNHFSTWIDFLILIKTIKTILKAGGR